jgi:hypothetical protein
MKVNALQVCRPQISVSLVMQLVLLLQEYFWFPNFPGLQYEGILACLEERYQNLLSISPIRGVD